MLFFILMFYFILFFNMNIYRKCMVCDMYGFFLLLNNEKNILVYIWYFMVNKYD